jgi:hypothetical protein
MTRLTLVEALLWRAVHYDGANVVFPCTFQALEVPSPSLVRFATLCTIEAIGKYSHRQQHYRGDKSTHLQVQGVSELPEIVVHRSE